MFSNCGLEEFLDDPSKQFQNGLFANGIWQKRKLPVGTFIAKLQDVDGKALGLTKTCAFDFEFALPKMPITVLTEIHKLYSTVSKKMKSEVYVTVFWDKVKEDYFLYVPKQTVSGAQVNFENNTEMLNNPDYICVMDSH